MRLPFALLLSTLPALVAAQSAPLPAWVRPDAASRSVTLELVAGRAIGAQGADLSGVTRGGVQVVVPSGWIVKLDWRNDDSTTHSFIVQQEREKLPERAGEPAFLYAYSRTPVAGMASGRTDHTQFVVDSPGWYWILCGVPGHAIGGEYISFRVDPAATLVSAIVKPAPQQD
ncbi:MAG: sulfocyanin-like copper-binding protein [Gemmatimonadota bacterium]